MSQDNKTYYTYIRSSCTYTDFYFIIFFIKSAETFICLSTHIIVQDPYCSGKGAFADEKLLLLQFPLKLCPFSVYYIGDVSNDAISF